MRTQRLWKLMNLLPRKTQKQWLLMLEKRIGRYDFVVEFSKAELMQNLLLYLLHGISLSPQIEMKFTNHTIDPVNGSSLCNSIVGKGGVTHHKDFKVLYIKMTDRNAFISIHLSETYSVIMLWEINRLCDYFCETKKKYYPIYLHHHVVARK